MLRRRTSERGPPVSVRSSVLPLQRSRISLGAAALALVTSGLFAGAAGATAAPVAKSTATHGYTAGQYIVTFADDPAATYEGYVKGYARTRPDAGQKLHPTRAGVGKRRTHLPALHDAARKAVGATKLADYTVTNNGIAAKLTAAQATKLAHTAGVVPLDPE